VLRCTPYASPWWATFKQIKELGGHVKREEHGTPVCFWKWLEPEEEDEKRIPLLRYYIVFNTEQCEGLDQHLPQGIKPPAAPLETAESIVTNMPHPPTIQHMNDEASYSPRRDSVTIPPIATFPQQAAYYSTLFHELTHSTGHASRLNRPSVLEACPFGSTNYSKEELIAEIGAAFLCAQAGIENQTVDNSAAYISAWWKKLSDDRYLLIRAAAAAQKAADYILGVSTQRKESDDSIS
jgi:antirestriction protein ArdC